MKKKRQISDSLMWRKKKREKSHAKTNRKGEWKRGNDSKVKKKVINVRTVINDKVSNLKREKRNMNKQIEKRLCVCERERVRVRERERERDVTRDRQNGRNKIVFRFEIN